MVIKILNDVRKKIDLAKAFSDGLIDSTSIIKRGDIPSYRLSENNKFNKLDGRYKLFWLLLYLKNQLLKYSLNKISINPAAILYCGHTENNIDQFKFFYDCNKNILSKYDYPSANNNLTLCAKASNSLSSKGHLLIKFSFFLIILWIFIRATLKLNKTTFEYALVYSKAFLQYYNYCQENEKALPRVVVFSNDHTPYYVGASRALKIFGVNRIYMQHGGVSQLFPKLDFEVAVLFDNKSKQIYQNQGTTDCLIFMISRNLTLKDTTRENFPKEKKRVILFPTSIPNIQNLLHCLDQLSANPFISEVLIKTHPRFKENHLLPESIKLIESMNCIRSDDICIVGNSTVTVELAKITNGLVYQYFDLDDIGQDYYGHAFDGISLEIKTADLSERFWKIESDELLKQKNNSLKNYCPILSGTHEKDLDELHIWLDEKINKSFRNNYETLKEFGSHLQSRYKRELTALQTILNLRENVQDETFDQMIEKGAISFDEYNVFAETIFQKERQK
jgi:hypothetical protein